MNQPKMLQIRLMILRKDQFTLFITPILGDFEGALECWNEALLQCGISKMPLDWGDSGFDYLALNSPIVPVEELSEPLVSVIMTTHK